LRGTKGKIDFMLFGYGGMNSTGAEAKLMATIADLIEVVDRKLNLLGKVTVLTQNIENQRRYIPDPRIELMKFTPFTPLHPWRFFNLKMQIYLLCEGSTFIDHFTSYFLWMYCLSARVAKWRGRKVLAYCNDCGHLKPHNQRLVANTLNKSVDLVMLRNPDAIRRMKEYGVAQDIHLVADGAYASPVPPQDTIESVWKKLELDPARRPVIGICPKEFFWWPVAPRLYGSKEDLYNWPFYQTWTEQGKESSRKYIEQTAAYADWCVDNYNADIALISMEHMDDPPCRRILEVMKHSKRARLVLSDEYAVDGIMAVLSALKFQLTTRYHSIVLASPFAVPMIAVSSDTRCEAVFSEIGAMDYFIDYAEHPNPVPKLENLLDVQIDKTESLLKEEAEWRNILEDAHQMFLERALRTRPIFQKWLEEEYIPGANL
jgi:polysaccharide pyruvyl transferase WcaK-like protein